MDILAHTIVYLFIACLIVGGLGLIVRICMFFYYRQWRSDSIKVYYDDNDHRKGYYIVKRPRGPYPVGYPKEKILKDMEMFELLRQEQKAKNSRKCAKDVAKNPNESHPNWRQILFMTPAEYMAFRRRSKEQKHNRQMK